MGDVTVRLAGRLEVLGGEDRSAGGPGGPVPRRLLALLAVHRGRTVPTPEIVDVLWATEPPKRPERAVATLVSRLRARYGPHLVTGGPPGYRLGAEVRVDLDQAAALVAVCERDLDPGPGRAALDLLAEEELLIGEPDAEWTRPARTTFDGLRRRARLALAAAALEAGDVGEARRTAAEAAAADPLDEPAHLLLMRASDRADALRAYERLRSALRAELGVGPSVEVRAAHTALLGGPAPEPAGARPALGGALVGRGPELARIAAAWSAARDGPARLVLVAGEGGMGKTRLVGVAAAATGRALEARCYAGERSLFLQPLADALAALPPERVREWAGPLADALGGVFPALAEGSAPPLLRRIFDALVAVLRGLTARHPAVLVLDDLHNASPSTVEFLHYLARRGADVRLLVLVTVRAHEGRTVLDTLAEVGERLDLGPLDEHAVARLAAAAGRPDLAAVLTARTRGHTLFVVESLRGLAAGEDGVPETLQAVVLARLRRVGRAVEDVLRAGAVLGPALDPAVVAGMLGRSPLAVAQACADAEAEGLLVPAERTYEFANDLVQEAIYRSTAPPLRITHHRRAADLLAGAGGDGLEALATHALAAGDHARAARALLAAAGRAAPTDAEALLTGALAAAAGDDDLRARVLLARGRCREVLGAWSAGLADLRVARAAGERAGDRRTVMLADRELGGHSAYALGEPLDTGAAHLAAALRAAGELGDRAAAADTLGWSAVVATNRLRFAEAVALGGRAVREARSAGTDRALVAALDGLKTGYAYLGAIGPLQAVMAELTPLLARLRPRKMEIWAAFESAFPAAASADWAGAEARIEAAAELCDRSGEPTYRSWLSGHLGWLFRLQGRLDEAVRVGTRAVEEAADLPHCWFGPCAAAQLGTTLLELGDTAAAVRVLSGGLAGADAEAYRLRCLGPLALATGRADLLAEADALVRGITAPPGEAWLLGADAQLAVASAWRLRGDAARALEITRPLRAAAERHGWVPVLVAAGRVDAVGDADRVARVEALAAAHGMGCNRSATALRRASAP